MRLPRRRRVRVEPRLPQPPPLSAAEWESVAAELGRRGPGVIGATGGSGTRVLARIVRRGGMFVGDDLNRSEDALDFAAFSDRWIDIHAGGERPPELAGELRALVVRQWRAAAGAPWGWKEPRSLYLLGVLAELPGLRFLHLVRDGRDMAFSANQVQLRKHGSAVLGEEGATAPERSIALWSAVNLRAADLGERLLGPRYLRLRFEDLCADPAGATAAVLSFFRLDGDALRIAAEEVDVPSTLGRWRERPREQIAALEREAGEALRRFGYQSSSE